MEKAKVYFTKEITEESLVKIYEKLGIELKGNVAVKLHSGEEGNQNYLRPEFVKNIIDRVGGTVVECNTAYDGARNTTEKHKKLILLIKCRPPSVLSAAFTQNKVYLDEPSI